MKFSLNDVANIESDERENNHNKNNNKRNNNHNNNRNNRGNYENNRNDKNKEKNHFKNPLVKIFDQRGGSTRRYKSKEVKKIVLDTGISCMLQDLKKWKKNNGKRPHYVMNALRDIMFAAVLDKAIKKGLDDKKFKKKDLDYLFNEILSYLHNQPKNAFDKDIYDRDTLKDIEEIYKAIIYKFNKKRISKLLKDVKGMSETNAKRIAILTASKDVRGTLYTLTNFLYHKVYFGGSEDSFQCSNKNIKKLFENCYGKTKFKEVLLYLMLEYNKKNSLSNGQLDAWSTIDQIMRDEIEKLPKKDIKKLFLEYADIRHSQELDRKINRRLGDIRTLHPDDYPKMLDVFNEIEQDDISLRRFFR